MKIKVNGCMLIKQKPLKNQQIASLVTPKSSVLDIGCGKGDLAPLLVNKDCVIDGLDIKLNLTETNKHFYRKLWSADLENSDFNKKDTRYDVVIFSDVLEHLRRPEIVLSKAKELLNKNGKIIISIPNVAYFSNRLDLLCGLWKYEDHGIMDRKHYKFFTLSTAKELIIGSGYRINLVEPETAVILFLWKRVIFSYLSDWFPTIFAFGWIFEAIPESVS